MHSSEGDSGAIALVNVRSLREQELTADLVNVMIIIWTCREALRRRVHPVPFFELSLDVCEVSAPDDVPRRAAWRNRLYQLY